MKTWNGLMQKMEKLNQFKFDNGYTLEHSLTGLMNVYLADTYPTPLDSMR